MKALVTGASSGLGLEMSRLLAKAGYDVVGVSRNERNFAKLKEEFPERQFEFISADLTDMREVDELIEKTKEVDLDFFFDNAGYGAIGSFMDDNIDNEMRMIDLNVKATHKLLKTFLKRFHLAGKGRVLVTASAAAFAPAPYMTTYYSTKAYVYYMCLGYWRELKEKKSKVTLSVLCPGPVSTNFEKAGKVKFNIRPVTVERCAKVAFKGAMKGKTVIVPSFKIKCLHFFSHFVPKTWITGIIKKSADDNA